MADNTVQSISEIQEAVKTELKNNTFFEKHSVPILVENQLDIDYQISESLAHLGILVTISTPRLEYEGEDKTNNHILWSIPEFTVMVAENPILNRSRAEAATALDTALQVAETLNEMNCFAPVDIEQTSESGLVIVTVVFRTTASFYFIKEEETY